MSYRAWPVSYVRPASHLYNMGLKWCRKKSSGARKGFHDNLSNWLSGVAPTASHGAPRLAMGPRGKPWGPMASHGAPWLAMGPHGQPWGPMTSHGGPWLAQCMGRGGAPRCAVDISKPWSDNLACPGTDPLTNVPGGRYPPP